MFAARVLGWGESAYGNLLGISNLIVGGLSLLVGGVLVDRYGPRAMALVGGFAGLVLFGGYAVADTLWANQTIFIAWFLSSSLFIILFYLSFLVMAMRVSAKEVAATSFSLIIANQAFGGSIGGFVLGPLEEMGGFAAIFGMAGITIFLASLFTLFMRREAAGPILTTDETKSVLTTD
ncbi:MAG: hypothetical protein ABJN65_04470 [Parasphingorhabdus sp.]